MRSAKFSIIKPSYKFYKIIPNNSVRNNNTHKVARAITSIYKTALQRVSADNKKAVKLLGKEFLMATNYNFKTFEKVSYFVYIEKQKIEFYFILPESCQSIILDKITDAWHSITISEVEQLPTFNDSTVYSLQYTKEDALSLKADMRDNDLLRANLNIVNTLEDGDKVGIFYNFMPASQFGWRNEYKETINKIKNKVPVDKNKGGLNYLLKYGVALTAGLINNVLEAFASGNKKQEKENMFEILLNKLSGGKQLSPATDKKENAVIVKTQVLIMSEAKEKIRKVNNARALTQSFETIAEDNRLTAKPYKKAFEYTDYNLRVPANKTSDIECQNFISLAGRELLEEYNFIDKVETKETQVPEELTKGKFCIGLNTFRGNEQKAYLSTDKEFQYLCLVLIGPNRAGKSTLIGNLGNDALSSEETIINLDFIGNCELSDEISELFPDKVLNIECSNFDTMQGLGYNEIEQSTDTFQQYANTKLQTMQLTTLVNSINSGEQALTTRMERYLQSAANVTFMSNGSIKDVFEVLQDHNKRHKFINKVPAAQMENLDEYIAALYELDEEKENKTTKEMEVVGTRYSRIDGIIDRLNKLKANPYMEQMLKKDTLNNVNLVNEMQRSQIINIRMPESMFATDSEKDIYATYWITKIWLALQVRKTKFKNDRNKMRKVNLFIDELYQVQNTEMFLTEKLSRLPKFNIKPIISCHYLNQLKHLRKELRSANASYMLIAGCDKENFNEFNNELYPYTIGDLLGLKRFNSLNLIKTSDSYARFITKMPKPIK
jgi:hypothetical protein